MHDISLQLLKFRKKNHQELYEQSTILKKSIHFSICIHIFKIFAACMHPTAPATLSYSTSLSTCAKLFWHCGHYILSYLMYSDKSGG